jgi:very-short-patch-repair endonuclease
MAHIDVAIAERAREQLGLLTRRDLDGLDLTRHQRQRRVDDGRLVRRSPNVFAHPAFPVTWHQRVLAAVLEGGDDTFAAFMSAAALDGFDGIGSGAVEALVRRGRRVRGVVGRIHTSRDLPERDVNRSALIPRTTPLRTVIDIAPRLGPRLLEQVLDHGARDGLFDPEEVAQRIHERERCGRARLDALLALIPGAVTAKASESWLESRALRIYAAAGIPLPRTQVVFDRGGGKVARVDNFWDDARLVTELMGHRTHSTRAQRREDAERRNALTLMGLTVIEFTYEQVVDTPDWFAAQTAAHLAAALSGRASAA